MLCYVKLAPDEAHRVAKILSVLDPSHPARVAAGQGADLVELIPLLERDDLVAAIEDIWFSAYSRKLSQEAGKRRAPAA